MRAPQTARASFPHARSVGKRVPRCGETCTSLEPRRPAHWPVPPARPSRRKPDLRARRTAEPRTRKPGTDAKPDSCGEPQHGSGSPKRQNLQDAAHTVPARNMSREDESSKELNSTSHFSGQRTRAKWRRKRRRQGFERRAREQGRHTGRGHGWRALVRADGRAPASAVPPLHRCVPGS